MIKNIVKNLKWKTESQSNNFGPSYKQLYVCYQTGAGAWLSACFLLVHIAFEINKYHSISMASSKMINNIVTSLKLKTESKTKYLGPNYKQLFVCYQRGPVSWLNRCLLQVHIASEIVKFFLIISMTS